MREKGNEGEREKGRKGEREKGRKGERESKLNCIPENGIKATKTNYNKN